MERIRKFAPAHLAAPFRTPEEWREWQLAEGRKRCEEIERQDQQVRVEKILNRSGNELWELKNAGVVTKNGPSWSLSDGSELDNENVGEMPASRVTEPHLTEALKKHDPQTADELAALFGVTSRKVASTLAMATKKSRVHRVAKDGKYRYCLPKQYIAEMQENQGNSKLEQQPERVKLSAPGITSLASTEDIVEVVQSIPSFTENRHDDMIFPSLHMANRELRRAKYKVQKWDRVCAALRELNKHRDIVTQFRKENALGRTIKSTG